MENEKSVPNEFVNDFPVTNEKPVKIQKPRRFSGQDFKRFCARYLSDLGKGAEVFLVLLSSVLASVAVICFGYAVALISIYMLTVYPIRTAAVGTVLMAMYVSCVIYARRNC